MISVGSLRGAPGATTIAALLSWAWPDTGLPRFVIEADPAGGAIAPRWQHLNGLAWEPGLLELATARSDIDRSALEHNSQPLAGNLRVLPARAMPAQVAAALTNLGDDGVAQLHSLSTGPGRAADITIDVGRIDLAGPAGPILEQSELVLIVLRPRLDEVNAALVSADALSEAGVPIGLVCIGDRPYKPKEIGNEAGADLVLQLPDDRRSGELFHANGFAWRGLRRSPLGRAMRTVAAAVAQHVDTHETAAGRRRDQQATSVR